MRRRHRHVEHADGLEVRQRRHAVVALLAFLVLALRLGGVDMDAQPRVFRSLGKSAARELVGGVLGVDVVVHEDAPVGCAVVALHVVVRLRGDGVLGIRLLLEEQLAFADVHLHARLDDGTDALVGVIVHVGEAHAAVTSRLGAGEQRAPVIVLGGHLRLEGPAFLVEPCLQGEVLGEAAQQRHGHMGVRVVERGHEQPARPVVDVAVRIGVRRRRLADVGDAPVFDAHPAVFLVVEVLVEHADVLEQHGLASPFSSNGMLATAAPAQLGDCCGAVRAHLG